MIAFFFALILNVDSVDIGIALWRDPGLRKAVEQAAIQHALEGTTEAEEAVKDEETTKDEENFAIEQAKETLTELSLPFGWEFGNTSLEDSHCWGGKINNTYTYVCDSTPDSGFWSKLVGILITTFAGMQGAPFWFDILNKVTNIRANGIKPKTTKSPNLNNLKYTDG